MFYLRSLFRYVLYGVPSFEGVKIGLQCRFIKYTRHVSVQLLSLRYAEKLRSDYKKRGRRCCCVYSPPIQSRLSNFVYTYNFKHYGTCMFLLPFLFISNHLLIFLIYYLYCMIFVTSFQSIDIHTYSC